MKPKLAYTVPIPAVFLLTIGGLICQLIAVLGVRLNLLTPRLGLQIFVVSGHLSGLLALLSFVWLMRVRDQARAQVWRAFGALCLGLFSYWPAMNVTRRAATAPMIHDISTDLESPPEFDKIFSVRPASSNPLTYEGERVASLQREAYPDLQSQHFAQTSSVTFTRALDAAKEMGWEIMNIDPNRGRIEAVARTALFGFTDDVVIRVRDLGAARARLDVRSVSRMGRGDLGANADRVRRFLSLVQD